MIFVGPGPLSVGAWVFGAGARSSRYTVAGVTRDNAGNILGNCNVDVFESVSKLWRGSTISDANGNYNVEITGDRTVTLQIVINNPNSTLSGASVNTLTAT